MIIAREVLTELRDLRKRYLSERLLFLPAREMRPLLIALGASDVDLRTLPAYAESLRPDPTLPFRRSRNGRFVFDFGRREIYRSPKQGFVLTEGEDFVRHDSGMVREFAELEVGFQQNSAFRSLLLFKALMVDGVEVDKRRGLDYTSLQTICTMFLLRTITSAEFLGEPALEGVHSDGVDHTMTTLIGHQNMSAESAKTLVVDAAEEAGKRWHEVLPQYNMGEVQHWNFLDTLLFADKERKHTVTPVVAADSSRDATRDMAIFFTRKPALPGHASFDYDRAEEHPDAPLHESLPPVSWKTA